MSLPGAGGTGLSRAWDVLDSWSTKRAGATERRRLQRGSWLGLAAGCSQLVQGGTKVEATEPRTDSGSCVVAPVDLLERHRERQDQARVK